MSDRRSFLRGLASLPLIGGGVALIGSPTQAAVPVTDALHERYLAFLAHEHRAAVREHAFRGAVATHRARMADIIPDGEAWARGEAERAGYMNWFPEAADIEALVASDRPSSRAAVVLATVGVGLTGGRHG